MGPQYWNTHRMILCLAGQMNHFFLPECSGGIDGILLPVSREELSFVSDNLLQSEEEMNEFQEYFDYIVGTLKPFEKSNGQILESKKSFQKSNGQGKNQNIYLFQWSSSNTVLGTWQRIFLVFGKSGSSVVLQVDSTVDATRKTSVSTSFWTIPVGWIYDFKAAIVAKTGREGSSRLHSHVLLWSA